MQFFTVSHKIKTPSSLVKCSKFRPLSYSRRILALSINAHYTLKAELPPTLMRKTVCILTYRTVNYDVKNCSQYQCHLKNYSNMTDIYRTVTYMYTTLHDDQPTIWFSTERKILIGGNGKTLI